MDCGGAGVKRKHAGGRGRKSRAGPSEDGPAQKKTPAATYSRPEGLPSAGTGLTTVFGMGTGVAPSGKPPENPKAPRGAPDIRLSSPAAAACGSRRSVVPEEAVGGE